MRKVVQVTSHQLGLQHMLVALTDDGLIWRREDDGSWSEIVGPPPSPVVEPAPADLAA